MNRYNGTDFSAEWKVVTYSGKTILAPWKWVKEDDRFVLAFSDAYPLKPLAGFSNYRWVAQAARHVDGVPVRE